MRALIAVIIVGFLAWSGWWVIASRAGQSGAETAFEALQAQGWTARHEGISVAGFPNRVDLTITRPEVAPPASSWGWRAPFVQLFALSYKPWHVIAALPDAQEIDSPLGPLDLRSRKLQGSLVVSPSSSVALERMQIAGEGLSLSGAGLWQIGGLSAAVHKSPAEANGYNIGLTLTEVTPDPQVAGLLPRGLLPESLPVLHLDALAEFTAPLDRHAADTRPEIRRVTIRELRGEWGPVRLNLNGTLQPDAAGYAEGNLQLRIEGAETLIELLGSAGVLAQKDMRNLSFAVKAMSGGQGSVTLPVTFARGGVTLALFPVGAAPRLR